jgi:hypothetical protein
MEQNHIAQESASASGTATDEPVPSFNPHGAAAVALPGERPDGSGDSPADRRFATMRAEEIYWAGVAQGIRSAGREPTHPHMPSDFSLDLTRGAADGALVSSKPLDAWPYDGGDLDALGRTTYGAAPDPSGADAAAADRAPRSDAFTPDRQRRFLDALAVTGVVADACRVVGISREAAYSLRKSAAGAAFSLGWDAALLIARRSIADDVMSRSRHGVIDRVYRNGELVAERHRYDNRLTMSVLTRLDRIAEGMGEGAATARLIAGEWAQFSRIVARGGEGAEAFLRARSAPPPEPRALAAPAAPDVESSASLLARLDAYRKYEAGLPQEIDTSDLDPADMLRWSPEQWARADFSGLLDLLPPGAWPQCSCAGGDAGTDGSCRICQLKAAGGPPPETGPGLEGIEEEEEEDDFAGRSVWEENDGELLTDFPPPPGFDGWAEGEPGDDDYRRELTGDERDSLDVDEETVEEDHVARLAEEEAARDRYFGFRPGIDPPVMPDLIRHPPSSGGGDGEDHGPDPL